MIIADFSENYGFFNRSFVTEMSNCYLGSMFDRFVNYKLDSKFEWLLSRFLASLGACYLGSSLDCLTVHLL